MTQSFSFDATDLNIVEQLRKNGRANNLEIAGSLGLSANTVSARIKRMEEANQLRVVAVSDFSAHGFNLLLRISVEVDGRAASDVAQELATLPEVFAVHLVTGRYDIDMLVALHDFEDLSHFMLDRLSEIHGIHSLTPAVVVDICKYLFDVAPIEAEDSVMQATMLDALDQDLISMLSRDARVSNRKIAERLDVTEGTVRGRIRRLQQDRLIAFTAVTGFEMGRRARLVFIDVKVDVDKVREVARTIADLPEVNAVLITMGQTNISAICLVVELDELVRIASDKIVIIPGVHRVETSISVKTIKYNPRIAKIMDSSNMADGYIL